MKLARVPNPRRGPTLLLALLLLWSTASQSAAQQTKPAQSPTPQPQSAGKSKLSLEQEMSLGLLRLVPDEVKVESDKAGAARIQAEVADTLWDFDEPIARAVFRTA